MSTDIEARLRDALAARADLVRPEDLEPLAPVVELRPRWQSPWVLLATAAVVLLVLGVVVQGVGGRERADRVAPQPDEPDRTGVELEIPADIGRDWKSDDISTPARLDLDGDGTNEKVVFLGEPTKDFDGRTRLQTTLSSTGEEAYGIAELGSTLGTGALDPIDADGDGDQELVLFVESAPMGSYPVVFDLRDGLLLETQVSDRGQLYRGQVRASGSRTEYYERVHEHDYWIEDGRLLSSRSVNSFASPDQMNVFRPLTYLADVWSWRLREDGALVPEPEGRLCVDQAGAVRRPCADGEGDALPVMTPVADERIGPGEESAGSGVFPVTIRMTAPVSGADATVVVETGNGSRREGSITIGAEPRAFTTAPSGVVRDDISLLVGSEDGDEVSGMQVLVAEGSALTPLVVVGDVPLGTGYLDGGRAFRTWLTRGGELFTAVADTDDEGGSWAVHQWSMVDRRTMVAVPLVTLCFEDVRDPSTARRC